MIEADEFILSHITDMDPLAAGVDIERTPVLRHKICHKNNVDLDGHRDSPSDSDRPCPKSTLFGSFRSFDC